MDRISRRTLLERTGGLSAALAVGVPALGAPDPAARKLKIVIAGGHPGDPEYGCGGTAARYSGLGHEVVMLYLNRGEGGCPGKSPAEAAAIRTAEAKKACEILRARPLFAGQIDGKGVVDSARYEEFQKILEAEHPDVVFTQWPIDNHPDHRAISVLAYGAWFQLGKRSTLYYYEVSNGEDTLMFAPTHYVDITAAEARKRAACYAHASQSPDRFYGLQDRVARFRGLESGYTQAEAYIRHVQSREDLLPPPV